jgi:predicted  nucleic acid-binding Zn-ribbon protein
VTEELRLHWTLHEIDEQAFARELVLSKHPEQRRAHESRIASARTALAALDQRVAESAKRRRTLDGEIAALEAQQKHFEKQSLAVTNQHQYEAVQHEIAAVRGRRDVLETEVLERLDAEEREAAARPEKAHALERADGEGQALFAKHDHEQAALRAELVALDARRAETMARLEPAARTRYEKLRSLRGGRAIAAVVNGACGGCHSGLPPHALQELRRAEKLLVCDGCGRLLLLPPPTPPAGPAA